MENDEMKSATNGLGDALVLNDFIEDPEGGVHSVTWYNCCGYSVVTFHVPSAREARALYKALQSITDYECD